MQLVMFKKENHPGIGVLHNGELRGLLESNSAFPGSLDDIVRKDSTALAEIGQSLLKCSPFALEEIQWLPPIRHAQKILCVGLNYVDHSTETALNHLPIQPFSAALTAV